ncbi:hypothetical protein H6P81_003523 [Aristolochia fimbriata]|uniref:Uncharacterized protein n=1 Tax=Aristolochia fimbriata TaxID=158543 RepID=A0AAV7FCU5_ARIFI|nr:hypothetical protein H6P81_003523 [Aristolochia fimbriata]
MSDATSIRENLGKRGESTEEKTFGGSGREDVRWQRKRRHSVAAEEKTFGGSGREDVRWQRKRRRSVAAEEKTFGGSSFTSSIPYRSQTLQIYLTSKFVLAFYIFIS